MTKQLPHILIVDDEELNREIILEILDGQAYKLSTAEDGKIAWELLKDSIDTFDVIILDQVMPEMDGMELLTRIRNHPRFIHCPVIMQTEKAAKNEILEGIKAGAYYYLTKPVEKEMLLSILGSAVAERQQYLALCDRLRNRFDTSGFIDNAQFRFKTFEEANEISSLLAAACSDSEKVINGLSEFMVNAIEHGNLGISYDEKSQLLQNGIWEDEIQQRLDHEHYKDRYAKVDFQRTGNSVEITISDDGEGFDWEKYLGFDPERAAHTHGRGIALANCMSFDNVEYQGSGNIVKLFLLED